jgi:transcriptional regulator with XRE-family HTH domain
MTHPLLTFRLRHDMTQEEFAAKIGRTAATISRWEAGMRAPSLAAVVAIVRATQGEVTADALTAWAGAHAQPSTAQQQRDAARQA